jgi:hypothetical protein
MYPKQSMFIAALAIVASPVFLSCSKKSDPPASVGSDEQYGPAGEPIEVREYHGEPSSVVCGVRWSHDHGSVYCDQGRVSLKEFVPFRELQSLRLADVTIDVGDGAVPRFERVEDLTLNNLQITAPVIVEAFPNVKSLLVSGTVVSFRELHGLAQLESLIINQVDAPDAQDLLTFPKLKAITMSYLRCPEPRCEFRLGWELKTARPEMDVRVMGRPLKPEKDAGVGSGT